MKIINIHRGYIVPIKERDRVLKIKKIQRRTRQQTADLEWTLKNRGIEYHKEYMNCIDFYLIVNGKRIVVECKAGRAKNNNDAWIGQIQRYVELVNADFSILYSLEYVYKWHALIARKPSHIVHNIGDLLKKLC